MRGLLPPIRRGLDAHCLGFSVIFPRVEGGIGCYEVRRAVKRASMRVDGRNQHIRVVGSLIVNFVVNHDLVFAFLYLHDLAKLIGLARLTLADNFRRWLEYTEDFALRTRVAAENPGRGFAS